MSSIHRFRFDFEENLFLHLLQHRELQPYTETSLQSSDELHRRHLLGTAVQLTEDILPDLYRHYQSCLHQISPDLSGDLYIRQSSEYNAYVSAKSNDGFDILMTSAMVQDFDAKELAFVIGHELGHVLFEHHRIPSAYLLYQGADQISQALAEKLLQWSMTAEISADRIGYWVCGDFTKAATALFKTASGLSIDKEQAVIRALRNQYKKIEEVAKRQQHKILGTHPAIPIRFKSLEIISLDLLSSKNKGDYVSDKILKHLNDSVKNILAESEKMSDKGLEHEQSYRLTLLIFCLLYVATADNNKLNECDNRFVNKVLVSSAGWAEVGDAIEQCQQNASDFRQQCQQNFSKCSLTEQQVKGFLTQCVVMSEQCSGVTHARVEAMQSICQFFGFDKALLVQIPRA